MQGLLLTATLADWLGLQELVNESVWLDYRVPGGALPDRKGDVAQYMAWLPGADSIDGIEPPARWIEPADPRSPGDSALPVGTFLRAFTFGHVRQFGRVLDVALAHARRPAPVPAPGRW